MREARRIEEEEKAKQEVEEEEEDEEDEARSHLSAPFILHLKC